MAEKKLFLRKATGLVREIGMFSAMLIVICNVVGLGWQKRVFQTTGWAPIKETELVLGLPPLVMAFLVLGVFVVATTVFVFAIMTVAMPRSGGGYVFISRIVHPAVGFAASWAEFFSIAVSYGLIAVATIEAILLFGPLAGIHIPYDPSWYFVGGVIIVILFAAVAALGVSMAGRLLHVMFWIPAIITVILYIVLIAATPEAMASGITAITGHTPMEFTSLALDKGMATAFTGTYWDAVSVAVLGAYWAYIGFAASTFVGGEIKDVSRNLPKSIFLANLFIILLYCTVSGLMARACMMVGTSQGYSFFTAFGYLSYGPAEARAALGTLTDLRGWLPVVAAFSAEGLGWGWIKFLLPIFGLMWVANDIPPFIITSSRIVFAMSFDRVLPEKLAEVSEVYHAPTWAIWFAAATAIFGCAAESDIFPTYLGADHILSKYISSGGGIVATDAWDAIFFWCASLAALLFPYVKPDIYKKSPFKPEVAGLPLVAIVGAIALAGNTWLLYVLATNPYEALNPWGWAEGFWMTVIIVVVGLLIYYYYKTRGERVGVDYTTIYAEIPPE